MSGPSQKEREKSPRRAMCAATLVLEAIVLGLSTPIMITLGDVPKGLALGAGLGLAGGCVLVSGMLRKEWGYHLGWALQVGAILLGLLTPTMWFLGALFALLWGSGYFLGRRIEWERAQAFAAYDAQQGE
ncbi:DUF4233 domain-containing protein [Nocardioides montaniterrae]